MFKRFVIRNRESCPCGSGLLYNECCKKKKPKVFHTKGEATNFFGKMMQKRRIKICLINGCSAKPREIIRAHALQENRLLNKIAVDNEVLAQNFKKEPIMLEIKKGSPEPFYFLEEMKIKDVTVATCFCKTHDNEVFEKIEKAQYPLINLNDEQKFLFAYKTFSFEYYNEIVLSKYYTNVFKEAPQFIKDKGIIMQYRSNILKLQELKCYKDYFDKALEAKNYSGLETITIELPYRIQFANYMMFSPPYDINGKKVNPIERNSRTMKYILFTAIPEESKSYLLISALREDMSVYEEYFEQIRKAPQGLIKYYINVFVPLYSQNIIVSPLLYDMWGEKAQLGLQCVVAESMNRSMVKGVQFGLKNLAKKRHKKEKVDIDSDLVAFNFFIPYSDK